MRASTSENDPSETWLQKAATTFRRELLSFRLWWLAGKLARGRLCSRLPIGSKNSACPSTRIDLLKIVLISRPS